MKADMPLRPSVLPSPKLELTSVTIIRSTRSAGSARLAQERLGAQIDMNRPLTEDCAIFGMAGLAAEQIFFGDYGPLFGWYPTRFQQRRNKYCHRTVLPRRGWTRNGADAGYLHADVLHLALMELPFDKALFNSRGRAGDLARRKIWARMRAEYRALLPRALAVVKRHRSDIKRLAEALLVRRTLTADEVLGLLRKSPTMIEARNKHAAQRAQRAREDALNHSIDAVCAATGDFSGD